MFRKKFLRSSGSILIEFAFSIPVLLTILYYVLDYPMFERIKAEAKCSAHMAVGMIQNISKHRESRRITAVDIRLITHAALMNFYSGLQSIHLGDGKYPLGHTPLLFLACVKGLPEGKAKIAWGSFCFSHSPTVPSPNTLYFENAHQNMLDFMNLKCSLNIPYNPSAIHPDLTIEEGEYKIILQAGFHTRAAYKYSDGVVVSQGNARRLFGFYMLPFAPLGKPYAARGDLAFMFSSSSTIIFTPNPGLFSDTPP
jgi:hypothetical protein